MSDIAIRNAEARLDSINSKIRGLEGEKRQVLELIGRAESEKLELQNFIDTWYKIAEIPRKDSKEQIMDIVDRANSKISNPSRQEVAKAAVEIIESVGRPMPRRELFQALKASGIVIAGKNAEMVLSTMLWRTKDVIVRLPPPYGYWPANQDFAEANYVSAMTGDLFHRD